MTRKPIQPHALISQREAERAIYIDCEGFEDRSPSLLGVLVGEQLEQIVLDPGLAAVARARGHRLSSFEQEILALLDRCKKEGRRIVAYSQHERNLVLQYVNQDAGEWYADARMIAKRWKNRFRRTEPLPARGLKDYLKLIEYPRGAHLGERKTTKRLKAVGDMVREKGSYEALTPVKKAMWTKLLEHNAIDCRGMQALVMRAARDFVASVAD